MHRLARLLSFVPSPVFAAGFAQTYLPLQEQLLVFGGGRFEAAHVVVVFVGVVVAELSLQFAACQRRKLALMQLHSVWLGLWLGKLKWLVLFEGCDLRSPRS